MIDPGSLRRDYSQGELLESQTTLNPIELFGSWLEEAIKANCPEPNAMVLSTLNDRGYPTSRVVLLKSLDDLGFTFYTNYLSDKGLQIQRNPYVALSFLWKELERQVRIEGKAQKTDKDTSLRYFNSRPRLSQMGAYASQQSSRVPSRDVMEKLFTLVEQQFSNQEIPLPDDWGGFIVAPSKMEFWQGRPSRLHDRLVYEKHEDGKWERYRLMP
jgi:pyridoxamine 5'-phosphate oxidase